MLLPKVTFCPCSLPCSPAVKAIKINNNPSCYPEMLRVDTQTVVQVTVHALLMVAHLEGNFKTAFDHFQQ